MDQHSKGLSGRSSQVASKGRIVDRVTCRFGTPIRGLRWYPPGWTKDPLEVLPGHLQELIMAISIDGSQSVMAQPRHGTYPSPVPSSLGSNRSSFPCV